MPEFTVIHIAFVVVAVLAGIVVGWLFRGSRNEQEKAAINRGWQEQLDARDAEHSRLAEQNKSLMEQVNQYQASNRDATMRAKELSDALKEAFERRDALQREIKDIRSNLESSVAERRQLKSDVKSLAQQDDSLSSTLAKKDERIAKLTTELDNWQNRLPPLIERFREKNEEAERLQQELDEARATIDELRSELIDPAQTYIEPVRDPDELTEGHDASNEPMDEVELNGAAAENDGLSFNSLRDDLQQIKGVGPAIEKTLNEMGIFRFTQIADMSEYDIDRVAKRLKGFRTRIYREDWIGQARALQQSSAQF
jgi:predicted flap endonuclease-1-like 5' DNA nuclease/type II secretory pathway pseudopilin PulG